jgi:transcriptional regulator with XRE-family HTH domain
MTNSTPQDSTPTHHQQPDDARTETFNTVDAPEESFPARLTALRSEKSLKHDSLSELTKHVDPQKRGIARTTLRGYELGVTKPGIRELRILSQALGVSTNRLIFGTENIDLISTQGNLPAVRKTVLGKNQQDIVQIVCFLVSLYRLGEQERETVYKVASSLASVKLGEVEYRKLMDATSEVVDTFIDAHSDALSGGVQLSNEQIKDTLLPLFNATLEKFGFNPMTPSA